MSCLQLCVADLLWFWIWVFRWWAVYSSVWQTYSDFLTWVFRWWTVYSFVWHTYRDFLTWVFRWWTVYSFVWQTYSDFEFEFSVDELFTALYGRLTVIFELEFSADELFTALYGRLTVILNLSFPLMNCLQLCMADLLWFWIWVFHCWTVYSFVWLFNLNFLLMNCLQLCMADLQWFWTWAFRLWTVYSSVWRPGSACPWPVVLCHSRSPTADFPRPGSSQTETGSPTNTQ